jgi:hypothetical protein
MLFKCQLGGNCPNKATRFYEVYGIDYNSYTRAFAYTCVRCEQHKEHTNAWVKEISFEEAVIYSVMES